MNMEQPDATAATGLRRLILCFDGTWNKPEDQTNVSRIYSAIADQHAGCPAQLKFYDEGVGSSQGSRVTGGALGWGLDANILEGYCWLINQYVASGDSPPESDGEVFTAGPDIFILGFSRGAFTARSLVGLINRCGLIKPGMIEKRVHPITKKEDSRATPDSALVKEAWQLYRREFDAGVESRLQEPCAKFRRDHCYNVKVKVLGVWDTVGALGVPMFSKTPLARAKYGFHDTSLGRIIENAYHAVAIDEQREDYQVALWSAKHEPGTKEVEQRWFPGAHANVGGGYRDDLLPDPPLRWIAQMAIKHGLEFTDQQEMARGHLCAKCDLPQDFELRGDEYLSPVRDSYADFLGGTYRVLRTVSFRGRYYRPMLTQGVNETIDESAHMKWSADPRYRPPNFAYAGRSDFTPAGHPAAVTVKAAEVKAGGGR
jgi:uncharacterized protein (DUF2235 family)